MKLKCVIGDKEMFIKNHTYKVLHWIKSIGIGTLYKIKSEVGEEYFVPLNGEAYKFEIVRENEMKELTLQQAFECEVGTKFDIIYLEGNKADVKAELYKGEFNENKFRWCDDEKEDLKLLPGFLNAKFIPIVEKEVSFMEAIKAYSEGNTIKNILDGNENIYKFEHSDYVEDKYGRGITQNEILEAKWYIID
ncbi:hypothetical protein CB452P1_000052 [Clostridium phage CB452P1]|nr:hypothetical protein CB452P1_000052 [Clostridium phage CB452P1]